MQSLSPYAARSTHWRARRKHCAKRPIERRHAAALLGDVGLDTLAADLKALGADPTAGLRKRRQQLSKEAEEARRIASEATNDRTLTDERTRQSKIGVGCGYRWRGMRR